MTTHTATHWAAGLVGLPYARGASGPQAFDCWGLVRWVFRLRHQVQLPLLAVAADGTLPAGVAAVMAAARGTGFAPVAGPLQPDDVLLMRNSDGGRHIGVVIEHLGGVKFLHAVHGRGVLVQPVADLRLEGFSHFETWRGPHG